GRIAHGVAFALVMLVGGLAGLMIAAVLGTETKTTVSGNAVQVDHEASAALLVGGAVSGLIRTGLAAWASGPLPKPGCAWAGAGRLCPPAPSSWRQSEWSSFLGVCCGEVRRAN